MRGCLRALRLQAAAEASAGYIPCLLRSYGQTIEVDYRGYDVTVENFLRVLTGAALRRRRRFGFGA